MVEGISNNYTVNKNPYSGVSSKFSDSANATYGTNECQLQNYKFKSDNHNTQGLSTLKKVAIGTGVVLTVVIGADLLFCKGKHVKNLLGKLKRNKIKPELKSEAKTAVKPEVKPEVMSEISTPPVKQLPLVQKISGSNINAISSDKEYVEVLEKLKNHSSWCREWNIEGANLYEIGLMPYTGKIDIHDYINIYMREGRVSPTSGFSKEILEDYIRVTDYALNKVDKTYGSYQGVVYRYGWFDPNLKGFTSTACSPYGAVCHADKFRPYKERYNIILTNHGTKIEKIQEKLGHIDLSQREQEIILKPGHKFEEIKTLTPELEELKQKLYKTMKKEHGYLCEKEVQLHFWQEI